MQTWQKLADMRMYPWGFKNRDFGSFWIFLRPLVKLEMGYLSQSSMFFFFFSLISFAVDLCNVCLKAQKG